MQLFEVSIETPGGRHLIQLIAAPTAVEARLIARDMIMDWEPRLSATLYKRAKSADVWKIEAAPRRGELVQ